MDYSPTASESMLKVEGVLTRDKRVKLWEKHSRKGEDNEQVSVRLVSRLDRRKENGGQPPPSSGATLHSKTL